jgi:hypothetical protein
MTLSAIKSKAKLLQDLGCSSQNLATTEPRHGFSIIPKKLTVTIVYP